MGVPSQWKLEMDESHEEKTEWRQDQAWVLVRGMDKEMKQWKGLRRSHQTRTEQGWIRGDSHVTGQRSEAVWCLFLFTCKLRAVALSLWMLRTELKALDKTFHCLSS